MHRLVNQSIRIVAASAVATHLALTVAYNMPANPARQAITPILDGYIGQYFAQNWRLFAPNPASNNLSVVTACLEPGEYEEFADAPRDSVASALEGRWVDITRPLVLGHQRSRLSAYDRLGRAQIAAARGATSLPLFLELTAVSCRKGGEAACSKILEVTEFWQKSAADYLARVASSYCAAVAPGSAGLALEIRERRAVPWSKRHDPDAEGKRLDRWLGTFVISSDVMPAPIYLADVTEATAP